MKYIVAIGGLVAALLVPAYRNVVADTIGASANWAIFWSAVFAWTQTYFLGFVLKSDEEIERISLNSPRYDYSASEFLSRRLPGLQRLQALVIGVVAFWFQVYLIYKLLHWKK